MPPRRVRSSHTQTTRSDSILGRPSKITKSTGNRETSRASSIRTNRLESVLSSQQANSISVETRTDVSHRVVERPPLPKDIADPVLGLMKNTLKGSIVDMMQLPNEVTQGLPIDVARAFLSPADWQVCVQDALRSNEELVLAVSTPLLDRSAHQCLVCVEMWKGSVHTGRWAVKIDVPSGLSRLQRTDFKVGWPEPFPLFPDKRRDAKDRIPSFNQMRMERSHFESCFGYIQWYEYVRKGL